MAALCVLSFAVGDRVANGQSSQSSQPAPPYIVEWVYRVKWGHQDEFWQIFKKYQIAALNKEKELGSVLKYEVFRPGLHTSEDQRWDYRIVIYYKDTTSPGKAGAIERQLFPDRATRTREENRRWELTEVHWDLPIRQIDPNSAPEE
jgi:hypothetical protein